MGGGFFQSAVGFGEFGSMAPAYLDILSMEGPTKKDVEAYLSYAAVV
jgi:hypothetical protein